MTTRPPISATVGVLSATAIAVTLSASVIAGSDSDLDGPATYLPVVAAVWLPAVVGTIGLRHPKVLLAAATTSFPLTLLSLAGATLPLLIPAVLYLMAYGSIVTSKSRTPPYVIAAFGLALGLSPMIPLFVSGGEVACSKTIRYSDGHQETMRVAPSEAGTLGSRADGSQEIASECSQGTSSWAGVLSLVLATSGVLVISYLGSPPSDKYVGGRAL